MFSCILPFHILFSWSDRYSDGFDRFLYLVIGMYIRTVNDDSFCTMSYFILTTTVYSIHTNYNIMSIKSNQEHNN